MISQFKEGLNSCGGLWDMIQSHWELFVPVMTNAQQQPLTLEEFKKLFTICYCRSDCQLRAAEEATVRHWETVLKLISGKHGKMMEDGSEEWWFFHQTLTQLGMIKMLQVFQLVV